MNGYRHLGKHLPSLCHPLHVDRTTCEGTRSVACRSLGRSTRTCGVFGDDDEGGDGENSQNEAGLWGVGRKGEVQDGSGRMKSVSLLAVTEQGVPGSAR